MNSRSTEVNSNKNACKFDDKNNKGHYESYFLRANHPEKAQAFWIRYTLFSPKNNPENTIGELWGAFFDGENNNVIASKNEFPIAECDFSNKTIDVKIGSATLKSGSLVGETKNNNTRISWELKYEGRNKSLMFLPDAYYTAPLPKAKSYIGRPNVLFSGKVIVNEAVYNIENWQGSENHNWGSKHTDEYAWGQVAGFDNDPGAFLECITARIKIGPFFTPRLTIICLLVNGKEYCMNTIGQAFSAKGSYHYFDWNFSSYQKGVKITGRIHAPRKHFVGLNYYNPPGGSNTCLNSKIASCEITIEEAGKNPIKLYTKSRAAFEILTNDKLHGVPVIA